jgi:hypothetical protein
MGVVAFCWLPEAAAVVVVVVVVVAENHVMVHRILTEIEDCMVVLKCS